ncbi:protein-glutamate O-methyltransferase CheR [Serpentinicella sp. ANB-PHB4]|uniref:CheR family methyltransferase n=1 Tax=Serpentinicella sp. ANB-PHB4 TaxID=3074076 RepID=UPI002859F6A4|nr:protein-glutamate O-methyltransferase CheR [Serpentinicella sp. ANB-PHB4]MDR5658487.1 protein-glutamate O-methyltransferase CheR [Serpentinicella sp. ANB-PHB4]
MKENQFRISDQDIELLIAYIKNNYGINLRSKKSLIIGRLQNDLMRRNIPNFKTYYNDYILADKDGKEISYLVDKLTTNHTFFMRENMHFEYLKKVIFPYLEKTYVNTRDLRIWSAGCSSGEEPYVLAMVINDYFGKNNNQWDTKILATDISAKALEIAKEGIYEDDKVNKIPEGYLRRYFKQHNNKYLIDEKIKEDILFRRFNLMGDFSFKKKFQVIFCRNVMIYFDHDTKKALVEKFYDWTEKGGYLIIGQSESINYDWNLYHQVMPSIYRKE